MKSLQFLLVIVCFSCFFSPRSIAQNSNDPDSLFRRAKQLAYEEQNYSQAIKLCNQILDQSPAYLDAQLLLGRLYYWNGQPEVAIAELTKAFNQNVAYEDAAQALSDILYFNKDYNAALEVSRKGLTYHPQSHELMLRKATILAGIGDNNQAFTIADSLLAIDPKNNVLLVLTNQLKEYSYINKLELTYDFTSFDKQYTHAWHLAGVSYTRNTTIGPVTGRINYANRFEQRGWQFETDVYPKLSKTFYTYVSFAIADGLPVFPKFRTGISLYANLPKAWEAEGGIRFLKFDSSIWTYTLGGAKYLGNFWFNGRLFLTQIDDKVANAYTFTTRYYLKDADNYASLLLGWGVSPDDRSQAVRLNTVAKLQTYRVGGSYRFKVANRHIVGVNAAYENVEYLPDTRDNQFNIAMLYQIRF